MKMYTYYLHWIHLLAKEQDYDVLCNKFVQLFQSLSSEIQMHVQDTQTANQYAVLINSTLSLFQLKLQLSSYFMDVGLNQFLQEELTECNVDIETRENLLLFKKHFLNPPSRKKKYILSTVDEFKLLLQKQIVNIQDIRIWKQGKTADAFILSDKILARYQ